MNAYVLVILFMGSGAHGASGAHVESVEFKTYKGCMHAAETIEKRINGFIGNKVWAFCFNRDE